MVGPDKTLLAIGSYQETDGLTTWWWESRGRLTAAGVADVPAPSFACWHPTLPVLYAVSEEPDGSVTSLRVAEDGSLTPVGTIATGGSEPCWVVADPAGTALLVANYDVSAGQSSMTTIRLAADGTFTGDVTVLRHTGSGPVADRQAESHVHQVVPTPQGTVLSSDLGSDRLVEYEVSARGVQEVGRTAMPTGSGPRHIALSSDGSTGFVSGELDGSITVIHRNGPNTWTVAEQVPCTAADLVPGAADEGGVMPSHVALAGRDRWLLVANRGTGSLACLSVSDELTVVAEVEVTAWPRHFALCNNTEDSKMALVAGQRGDTVEAVRLDTRTGTLESLGPVATVPSASCVAVRI